MAKKLYFKIGEACKRLDIQPYVLRYWETEFQGLSPNKSKSGQRVYSEEDLRVIQRIKELLYEEGYTIAGAKKKLAGEAAEGKPVGSPEPKKKPAPAAADPPKAKAEPAPPKPATVKPEPKPEPKPAPAPKKAAKKKTKPVAKKAAKAKAAPAQPGGLSKEARAGIQKALKEARAILKLLDS